MKLHGNNQKEFGRWIQLKEILHFQLNNTPDVHERDLWWASVGENVGSEMNGKSEKFSRPVLIIKKLAVGFYLVAPSTSQEKDGSWYVEIQHKGRPMYICLHQIRTIDCRRLWSRLGQISGPEFKRVKNAFWKLYR